MGRGDACVAPTSASIDENRFSFGTYTNPDGLMHAFCDLLKNVPWNVDRLFLDDRDPASNFRCFTHHGDPLTVLFLGELHSAFHVCPVDPLARYDVLKLHQFKHMRMLILHALHVYFALISGKRYFLLAQD